MADRGRCGRGGRRYQAHGRDSQMEATAHLAKFRVLTWKEAAEARLETNQQQQAADDEQKQIFGHWPPCWQESSDRLSEMAVQWSATAEQHMGAPHLFRT